MARSLRLFVCEYVTGGGCVGAPLPASLVVEGELMLRRLVEDVNELARVQVTLTRDPRLPEIGLAASVVTLGTSDDPWGQWCRVIAHADLLWPIAPESGGSLERLCALARAEGSPVMASGPGALRIAGSKLRSASHLGEWGLPVVPTYAAGDGLPHSKQGWVAKPDDGAGTVNTRRFNDEQSLRRWLDAAGEQTSYVVQPYIPGASFSLSLLCKAGRAWLLACNRQLVAIEDSWFRYRGTMVADAEALRPTFEPIAEAVAAAMPELFGHVGIDVIQGPDGVAILDVNPRLTVSCVGLREAIGANPAALALELLERDLDDIRRPLRHKPVAVPVDHGP